MRSKKHLLLNGNNRHSKCKASYAGWFSSQILWFNPWQKLIQARVFIVFILMDVFPEYPYRYLKEPRGFMELSTPHKKHQTEKSGPIILSPPLSRSWAKPNKHCETKQKSYFHYHLSWTCKLKDLENNIWLKTKIVLKDD